MKLIEIEHCSTCPYDIDGWCLYGDHDIDPKDFLKSPNFPDSCTLKNATRNGKNNGKNPMVAISSILKEHGILTE